MGVLIHVPMPLRQYCDRASSLSVPAGSVRTALEQLERDHPVLLRCIRDETGAVRRHVNLFVNASNVRDLQGLDTPLAPGDELFILPAVSGG